MKSDERHILANDRVDKEIVPFGIAESPLPVGMVAAKLAEKGGTWYFGHAFKRDETSPVLRSRFYFGIPLEGYESREDRYEEQQELFRIWLRDVVLPYLETASSESLQVIYAENFIRKEEIRKVVVRDGTF